MQVEIQRAAVGRERGEGEAQRVRAERGDAGRELLARALLDRGALALLQQPVGPLGDQRVDVDTVDEVERVEGVALRLRHLLAFLVAHQRVDVDGAKRHFAGEVGRHHHHPRDPEEDDVEAGHQHRRGQERPQLGRVLRPAQRRVAPQRRREPGVEDVLVLHEGLRLAPELRARRLPRSRFVARDVDVAGVVVPRRDPVPPPELARDAPVLDVVDPVQVGRQPLVGYELDAALLAGARTRKAVAHGGEAEVLDRAPGKDRMRGRRGDPGRHEPLVGEHRLGDLARAFAARHHHLVRLLADEEPLGREIGEHRLARDVAIEPAILRRRVVAHRRVEVEDRDRREVVAPADLPVVEIVRRRHLDAARAEGLVDVVVGDHRDRATAQRQRHLARRPARCSARRRDSPRWRRRPASSPGAWSRPPASRCRRRTGSGSPRSSLAPPRSTLRGRTPRCRAWDPSGRAACRGR